MIMIIITFNYKILIKNIFFIIKLSKKKIILIL